MGRKISLSPTEREVLWVLSEAEEENLSALVNAVSGRSPALSRQELMMASEKSLRNLYRQRLIDICAEKENHGRVLEPLSAKAATEAISLARVLRWDEDRRIWCWNPTASANERTVITLTEKGRSALRS